MRATVWITAAVGLLLGAGCTAARSVTPTAGSSGTTTVSAEPVTGAGLAADVLARIQQYWEQAYPTAFDATWPPLRSGVRPVDSDLATGAQMCLSDGRQLTGNAFYCPNQDGIVYDTAVFVPVLVAHYGPAGLFASLAHEFGHAVAARAGIARGLPVLRELQADCFAGTAVAATLPTTDVVAALAPLLDFADQPALEDTDPTAHGSAVDRARAFQLGYRQGPSACRDISSAGLDVVLSTTSAGPPGAPPDSGAEAVPAADAGIAQRIGPFAGTAAATVAAAERSGLSGAALGCKLGELTSSEASRPADPDQALNFLRARPGADADQIFGFLDGFAGSC